MATCDTRFLQRRSRPNSTDFNSQPREERAAAAIQQTVTPDNLRGRLAAFNILIVAGGPSIGDVEAGIVATAFTPVASVVSGGLLCIAGVGAIAALVPRFARWQPGDPP